MKRLTGRFNGWWCGLSVNDRAALKLMAWPADGIVICLIILALSRGQ